MLMTSIKLLLLARGNIQLNNSIPSPLQQEQQQPILPPSLAMPLPLLSSLQPQSLQRSSDNAFQESTIQTNTVSSAATNSFIVTFDHFGDFGINPNDGTHPTAQRNIRYTGQIILNDGSYTVSSVSGTCDQKFFLNGVLTEHKTGSPTYGAFQLERDYRLQLGIVSDNSDFCYWSSTHLVPINIPLYNRKQPYQSNRLI
jgi:hypothetical protein